MDIKTSSISCWTFWIPAGGSSYSAPSASNTATISEFLFLKVSFASIRKNFFYFLFTAYVTVISQGLHLRLVKRNEGKMKTKRGY